MKYAPKIGYDDLSKGIIKSVSHDMKPWYAKPFGDLTSFIALMVAKERKRCIDIIDAEREFGGSSHTAEWKISTGEDPRHIPGYNNHLFDHDLPEEIDQ